MVEKTHELQEMAEDRAGRSYDSVHNVTRKFLLLVARYSTTTRVVMTELRAQAPSVREGSSEWIQ